MADSFTITVSVAGLASLGVQLAQGLKKYADSALDSKGRILAISIDIELAVQVIKTLDATLQNASSRALLTDDAKKLAKDVVSQCKGIFDGINALLPDIKRRRTRYYSCAKENIGTDMSMIWIRLFDFELIEFEEHINNRLSNQTASLQANKSDQNTVVITVCPRSLTPMSAETCCHDSDGQHPDRISIQFSRESLVKSLTIPSQSSIARTPHPRIYLIEIHLFPNIFEYHPHPPSSQHLGT